MTCRLVVKEQEIQGLQAEFEARIKELSEKMEQMHQQVRRVLHARQCRCDMFWFVLGMFVQL